MEYYECNFVLCFSCRSTELSETQFALQGFLPAISPATETQNTVQHLPSVNMTNWIPDSKLFLLQHHPQCKDCSLSRPEKNVEYGNAQTAWGHNNSLHYLYCGNAASGVYEFKGLSLGLALDVEAAHEVDERAVVAVAAGVGHAAPLHAGVVFLVLRAVEVLVLAPVQVALAADAAALKVLLDQVDNVLEVEVVSVALYQLVRQLVLEELSQLVGVDEAQGDYGHLRQEEYQ